MNMPVIVVASGGLPVQESTTGTGLPLVEATSGALPVTLVDTGGVPCLDPLGTIFDAFSLTAPVLALLTDATDNTPLWSFDLVSPLAGDVIRIEWDDAIPYATQVNFSDYTLTSGDLSGDFDFDFGLSAFADGPWSWRAYHRRGGSSSAVSNEVSITLATTPTYSRTAATNNVGAVSSHTFTGVNIGTASATRVVLVAAFCNGLAGTVTGMTIGGNAATLITGTNLSNAGVGSSVYRLAVSSGATADIALTWSGTVGAMGIIVYALDGVNVTESAKSSSAGFGGSDVNTLTIPASGFAISFSLLQNAVAAGTFTNCTEDGSRVFVGGGTSSPMQSAYNTTAGSQSPTITPPANDVIIHHTIAYGP